MLKELFNAWGENNALAHIYQNFDDMINIAKDMFVLATKTYDTGGFDITDLTKETYRMDGRLNTLQQEIRRQIIIHISVNGTAEIIPCLQLMSLVKDAERLGDYAKNILETSSQYDKYETCPSYDSLLKMRSKIISWFDEVGEAVEKQDKSIALNIIKKAYDYEKECDQIICELVTGKTKTSDNPIAGALQFRYLKRVIAHLGNILSSVTMPLDKLDYYDE